MAGIVVTVFGAGVSFQIWVANRPTREELAPILSATNAAQAEAFSARQEIRQLRKDLARFAGRALAPPRSREAAGRLAAEMYHREIQNGATQEEAMSHVLDSNF
jgi:hypothetical protein